MVNFLLQWSFPMTVEKFFSSQPYPPLLQERQDNCNPVHLCNTARQNPCCFRTTMVALAVFVIYNTYSTISSLTKESARSFGGVTDAMSLAAGICGVVMMIGCAASYYRNQKRLIAEQPYLRNYTGNPVDSMIIHATQWFIDEEYGKSRLVSFLNDLEGKGLLHTWLKKLECKDIEEGVAKLLPMLREGLCFGYSMALLSMMRQHHDKSGQELVSLVDRDAVFYFQYLQYFILDSMKDKKMWENLEQYCSRNNLWSDVTEVTKYDVFFHFLGLAHEPFKYEITRCNGSELVSHFQTALPLFEGKCTQMGDRTMCGIISLYSDHSDSGHALFFQCHDGKFRFHETGKQMAGFYEFHDAASLVQGLNAHIKTWEKYDDLQITFTAFPIQSNQVAIEINDSRDLPTI